MSEKDIIKLCCETFGTIYLHAEWYAARQLRLSASKSVHSIKTLYMEMTKESNTENDENIDTSNTDSCAENEISVDNNNGNEISPVPGFYRKNIINQKSE
ncbi:hypothetical protein KQX54_000523 [Cotesia glomerata]|uniref:Uncharacterized protein n=1 Tax=Cotesia glomerata TaxID=32391 RepID=A0AAV7I002_COTGL|nr:hypothetical protein KQX54_000523 [Cotesia glomerata]